MPDLLESPAATPAPSPSPLTASFGDMAGDLLSSFKSGAKIPDNPADKPEVKAATVEPTAKPEDKLAAQKPPQEKAVNGDQKPQESSKPSEEKPKPSEKEKFKAAAYSEETQTYLKASEVRKAQAFEEKNAKIKALSEEMEPLKKEIEQLRQSSQTLPKERDDLKAEVEKLREQQKELSGKVTAYDVRATPEYKAAVIDPWNAQVVQPLKDLAETMGFDGDSALDAIRLNDRATINQLAAGLNPVDAQEVASAYRRGQELIAKDKEYEKQGADAMTAIKERQTKAERDAIEATRREVDAQFPVMDAAAKQRFAFLAGESGDEKLDAAIKEATRVGRELDLSRLSPKDQAYVAHAATVGKVVMDVLQTKLQDAEKELQATAEAHTAELAKKDEEIKALQDRIDAQNGASFKPGNGRDAGGKFVAGGEAKGKTVADFAMGELSKFR